MSDGEEKAVARTRVAELVRAFSRNDDDYLRSAYNETLARTDFISPLLEAFGWDVRNVKGQQLAFREVIEETTVEVGEERLSKRPDYELRLARQRKLFVEAKKPSVNIDQDRAAAFQTRRYGYSASLPISIVTNFHQLAVYDCRPRPAKTDEPHVARYMLVSYKEFDERFDDLWLLLAREAVYSGAFDKHLDVDTTRRGAEQFDDFFLRQVRDWRQRLAIDIHANSPGLSGEELTYAVQLFLSRIVFLRICEDRDIEKYETLRDLDADGTFEALLTVLRRADKFYNSGLFRLIDDAPLGVCISDETLVSIINELYYPQSPYTFAVVETEVLGEIYEQFLGEVITIEEGAVKIISKPEVRESGGVVPTPSFIADAIVVRALGPTIAGKGPDRLDGFTIADICCGSGIFLVFAYSFLLDHYLNWYLNNDRAAHVGRRIYEVGIGQWRLTFEERRRILLVHLRGVDIDPNAVEVAQFSLLLKLIEDESAETLRDYVERHKEPVLPSLDEAIRCGNTLVSADEWREACGSLPAEIREQVNAFTWADEFEGEIGRGGFNAIVGNPPYIRIQNMTAYSPKEVTYYQHRHSPFATARQDNFDKYAVFLERALSLVQGDGRIGMIVPHKFMTIRAGRALRRLLTTYKLLEDIVHFGVKPVFGRGTSNYTCILMLNRAGADYVRLEKAGALEAWRYGQSGSITDIPADDLGEEPWHFADEEARALFARVRAAFSETLCNVAEILVGLQTSADEVFILHPIAEDADTVTCRAKGRDWEIERGILRPCLHDAALRAYARPQANARMIFPYELVEHSGGRIKARLLQPDELAAHFPGCWAYLRIHKAELEQRNISGGRLADRKWYQYGRSQSLTKFDRPKIVLPVLSIEPRYSYDDANTLFTGGGNGPYYMVRPKPKVSVSNYYLMAVLNHPLSESMIRTNTSVFRGGYYSHGKQFIQNLPVPIPDEAERAQVDARVADLTTTLDELEAARTPREGKRLGRAAMALRTEIEHRMSAIFRLSEADMATVQGVPVPE